MSPVTFSEGVRAALHRNLHEPVEYVLSRPSKGFRSRLVELSCQLVAEEESLSEEPRRRCAIASSLIERIHAGSLIVDDIEDESVVRRDAPTLHLKYGVARALNAGNWLYFEPLTTIQELGLKAEAELQLHRDCLQTLSTAHCGQALDIGTKVDELAQNEVAAICASSLEWKTGELVGLAFRLGGYAADASPEVRDRLFAAGKGLGIGLQMLDDVGNFAMKQAGPMAAKRHEDMRQRRPSWIWSFVATHFSAADYALWIEAVRALPFEEPLQALVQKHDLVARARGAAVGYLRDVLDRLQADFPAQAGAHAEACLFLQKLEKAYE